MSYEFFLFLSFRTERSAVKNLSTSTNSPLERGRGVLECIRFVCITHPLPPLKRGVPLLIVIQSEAKNLNTYIAFQILPPFGRLDDKGRKG